MSVGKNCEVRSKEKKKKTEHSLAPPRHLLSLSEKKEKKNIFSFTTVVESKYNITWFLRFCDDGRLQWCNVWWETNLMLIEFAQGEKKKDVMIFMLIIFIYVYSVYVCVHM